MCDDELFNNPEYEFDYFYTSAEHLNDQVF